MSMRVAFFIILFSAFYVPGLACADKMAPLEYLQIKAAGSGLANSAVIFLHGLGGNETDMAAIATYLSDNLPDTVFIMPRAPYYSGRQGSYQWYPATPGFYTNLVIENSHEKLSEFIHYIARQYDVSETRIVLGGFSQGGVMSLYTGLRRGLPYLISFSGRLMGPLPPDINTKKILLTHGGQDQIIEPYYFLRSQSQLAGSGSEIVSDFSPVREHEIDESALYRAQLFLHQVLGNNFME
jgi:phospholipase/carboxylesterase